MWGSIIWGGVNRKSKVTINENTCYKLHTQLITTCSCSLLNYSVNWVLITFSLEYCPELITNFDLH